MKIIVFVLLAAIVISLGTGLYELSRKDSDPKKLARALTIRVALSALLIVFLLVSYKMGYIQ